MARGDMTIFQEALAKMLDGDWASTDAFKVMLITNAVVPTAGTATPTKGDFTECSAGGNYSAGGTQLGTNLASLVTQASGTLKWGDELTTTSWAQHASNPTDAYYAVIYNSTDAANDCLAFLDLGGPVDMTAGDLTITWHTNGVFTIA